MADVLLVNPRFTSDLGPHEQSDENQNFPLSVSSSGSSPKQDS